MLIKFIRSITPYIAGETADFPTARAQAYIDAGKAVLVTAVPPSDASPVESRSFPTEEAVIAESGPAPVEAVRKPVRGRRKRR